MRIAHFLFGRCNLDSANGVEKTVYHLCFWQAKQGHDVALYQLSPKEPIPIPGVDVRTFGLARSRFRVPKELIAALDRFAPDIVHLHSAMIPENWALARFCDRRGIPYVVTPNGNYSPSVLATNRPIKLAFKALFDLPLARRSAFVHSVGDTDAIRAYGYRGRVVQAPNGVEVPPSAEADAANAAHVGGRPTVVYVGRLHVEQKGLDILLEAFARVRSELPQAQLTVAGPDWKGGLARLQRAADALGLEGSVRFLGPVYGSAKTSLLDGSSVFVHVSRWEGLSLGVLEALARSMLTVLSRAADPLGLVCETQAGIVCDAEPQAVAGALMEALELPAAAAARHRQAARKLASDRFSWEASSATVVRAYESVVGPGRSERRAS